MIVNDVNEEGVTVISCNSDSKLIYHVGGKITEDIKTMPVAVMDNIKSDIDRWYQRPYSNLSDTQYSVLMQIFNKHIGDFYKSQGEIWEGY